MRYKVRAPDMVAYEALLEELNADDAVEVFTASARRRLIGTGDLPEASRRKIRRRGGEIAEDYEYDLEHPG
jgi:hypothetical protein